MSNFDGNALAKDAYGRPPDLLEKKLLPKLKNMPIFKKSKIYDRKINKRRKWNAGTKEKRKRKKGKMMWEKRHLFKEYRTQKQDMWIFYNLWCTKSEI